mmetsp:Transcript_23556/g.38876  ORF Transcript_23556/g.38876 Transcript_23556/m.38876 type:complete len:92 (+) Transcript_23556:164-439(+)
MARDELGLDPYQRSAINCARVGAGTAVTFTLAAIGLFVYLASALKMQMFDGSLGTGVLVVSCVLLLSAIITLWLSRKRLSKEDISWDDALC